MMEFTYNGIVRYGFGFYNPNHAAALICAVIPFLWGWKRCPLLGWLLSLCLTVPLALTYSRTGVLVLIFELAAYFILTKTKNWKFILGIVFGIGLIAGLCGVLGRFAPDKAVTNRPEIWLAGLKLCAANPSGVGLGNSGNLASTFLLNGIECRTLINSHLTLFTEFGIFAGFVWIAFISYALIQGIKRHAAWCAFAGLTLSASAASVFDWSVLFDFREYGTLPLTNFILSWLSLLFFFGLGGYLAWGKTTWKRPVLASGIAVLFCIIPFCFYSSATPKTRDGFIIKNGTDMPLVLYDDSWTLKNVLPFFKDGYRIPLHPGKHLFPAETVWLFGNTADYAKEFPAANLIFVSPPEFWDFTYNTRKIYLKRVEESYFDVDCEKMYY